MSGTPVQTGRWSRADHWLRQSATGSIGDTGNEHGGSKWLLVARQDLRTACKSGQRRRLPLTLCEQAQRRALIHNVDKIIWDVSDDQDVNKCMNWIEERIHNVLNNHLHIEHPLQASYTAAMFFLFQDATVKDVIMLSDGSISLKFDKNVQKMALKLVIPLQSLWFSLFGCGLLCLSVLVVVVHTTWMRQRNDPLDRISEAQVVGQVMVDESKYSPFLLHRRLVRHENHRQLNREAISGYTIDEIALQHHHDLSRERVRFYRGYCERPSTPTASTVSMSENPWILSQFPSITAESFVLGKSARSVSTKMK